MDLSYQIPRSAMIWILLSVAIVLLPQSARMPAWISIVAVVCIVWRILIFTGKLNYPSRWIRVLVVLFTLVVSISQMRSIGIGLDSAAALLALGFVFKLIEMKQKRDIYVVISLCFVMTMVAFLYSQSILATAYSLLSVVVILGAMIALNRSINVSDNWGTSIFAGKILLQAMPLAIVLFYGFPRIAPLWAVPIQSSGASTGVSDEMSPGDISSLGRSGDLAFRVQFETADAPAHESLYWRGLVLTDFDGETWRRESRRSAFSIASARADQQLQWDGRMSKIGAPVDYNIILEPTQRPWVYGLHLAEAIAGDLFQSRNFLYKTFIAGGIVLSAISLFLSIYYVYVYLFNNIQPGFTTTTLLILLLIQFFLYGIGLVLKYITTIIFLLREIKTEKNFNYEEIK